MTGEAGAIAAMRMRSERRIIATLRQAGAVAPDRATELHRGGLATRGALRSLVRNRAVIEAGEGRYWLDDAAYEDHRNRRRSRIFLVLFGIAALLIVLATVTIAKAATAA